MTMVQCTTTLQRANDSSDPAGDENSFSAI